MAVKEQFTWNRVFNILAVAAPIVAGVVAGGVFTPATIITALGVIAAKAAQSFTQDAQDYKERRTGSAEQSVMDKRGQATDDEDPE